MASENTNKLKQIPEKYKGKTIYSFSRLGTYKECPHQYYLTYKKRLKQKENPYTYVGTSVHDVVEGILEGKLDVKAGIERFEKDMFELEIYALRYPSEQAKENLMKSIRHFIPEFKGYGAQKYAIEKEFFLEIPKNDGTDDFIVIRGFIDVISLYSNNEIEIIDIKTSSKFKTAELDEKAYQLLLYNAYIRRAYPQYKVRKLAWHMVKYCLVDDITSKRKPRIIERSKLGKELEKALRKKFDKAGISDFETEMYIDSFKLTNNFNSLPDVIKKDYVLSDWILEYEFTEEREEALFDYIRKTVEAIETKSDDASEWLTKDIAKDTFFCVNLCPHGEGNCIKFQEWANENKDKVAIKNEFDDLFA